MVKDLPLLEVWSGAQTGADRAGIDEAIFQNMAYGGWIPKGRKAEDGPIHKDYVALRETDSDQYPPRTALNVQQTDATVIFYYGAVNRTRGCSLTSRLCFENRKPWLGLDVELWTPLDFLVPVKLQSFVIERDVKRLNVAGCAESHAPGIYDKVRVIMRLLIRGSGDLLNKGDIPPYKPDKCIAHGRMDCDICTMHTGM